MKANVLVKKQQGAVLTTQTRRRRVKNTILGLVAGLTAALVGCFTGDDLVDQPCQVDADCNALADALGETLTCRHNVCGYTTRCGDGIVDESEECDNGPLNVDSDYSQRAGDCSATTCTLLPFCGDEIVQNSLETCDDGNTDNTDSCLNTCVQAFCGDGFVGPGEACDPEAEDDCTEDCTFPNCGDGLVNGLEECDDGNDDDTDSCLNLCLKAGCGDGILWTGVESCDDGNENNADACLDTCQEASCGDGYTQLGVEECDDGNGDSRDDCLATCKLATCGDGQVHYEEACDDGNDDNSDGCTVFCENENCGDGVLSEPEQCDDGNNVDGDGCSSICKFENCGDFVIQPPEECDDGNDKTDDDCVFCKNAKCGDATVWKNHEQCDDGNDLNTDACVNCNLAVCGDGFAWQGQEECDDGNDDNTDSCLNTCVEATCGDGFVHEGSEEECDDGNDINDDACRNNCKENYCGDAVVDPGSEGCDDGNDDMNDGCHDCKMGAEQIDTSLAESRHVCAVRDGKVRCWGSNKKGNLGYGNTASLGDELGDMPYMSSVDVGANVKKIVTGGSPDDDVPGGYTCVLLDDEKSVYCWGYRRNLGYLNYFNDIGDEPGEMPPQASNQVDLKNKLVKDIDAGSEVACALTTDGEVYCWGQSLSGQLGKSGVSKAPTPGDPINISGNSKVVQISVGLQHTCAVLEDKSLRCWGRNNNGQLGYGNTTNVYEPSELGPVKLGQSEVIKQVSAGWRHTCVLFESNRVRCWGVGNLGQLGNWDNEVIGDSEEEEPSSSSYNARVLTPDDTPIRSIHAGYNNTCALLDTDGVVKCWGGNGLIPGPGHIGDSPNELAQTISLGGSAQSLTMGRDFICALMDGGAVRCWGDNESGQLGLNHTNSVEVQLNNLPPPPEDAKVYPKP